MNLSRGERSAHVVRRVRGGGTECAVPRRLHRFPSPSLRSTSPLGSGDFHRTGSTAVNPTGLAAWTSSPGLRFRKRDSLR